MMRVDTQLLQLSPREGMTVRFLDVLPYMSEKEEAFPEDRREEKKGSFSKESETWFVTTFTYNNIFVQNMEKLLRFGREN